MEDIIAKIDVICQYKLQKLGFAGKIVVYGSAASGLAI